MEKKKEPLPQIDIITKWDKRDEDFCPTCEKIVRSGYQLGKGEFHIEKLNEGEVSFADAFNEIVPILGLLRDNYYVMLDTELYPTDGNGHLFWNVPDSNQPMPGSCLYYRGDGEWGLLRPYFTVATQSIKNLNKSRVDYYREHYSGCYYGICGACNGGNAFDIGLDCYGGGSTIFHRIYCKIL